MTHGFELEAHLVDDHGFPTPSDAVSADDMRAAHRRDHIEGGYYDTLHHIHTDVNA